MAKAASVAGGSRLNDLIVATPPSRDRYVDFLRAASIAVVVLGHWLSSLVVWRGGVLTARNAVGAVPGLWCTTWVLQVMPVFFFVGGFSNFRSFEGTLRRGEPAARFLKTRLVRLLTPTGVFIWVWVTILLGLFLAGSLAPGFLKAARILVGPLWFLLVYLFVTALTPVTYRLHSWFGMSALAIAVFFAAAMDVLRFSFSLPGAGWANVVFIWLFAHQLGYFYADGTLVRVRQRVHLVLALFGLAGLLGLTLSGLYPKSMVGTGFEKISNMNPPTICIVALTLWLVGVAMSLRRAANRWLARPGPWKLVVAVNSVIMTIYLWHLTAYGAVFGVLALVGFSGSVPGTTDWWLERTIWVGGSVSVLVPLVLLFGRFERPTLRPAATD